MGVNSHCVCDLGVIIVFGAAISLIFPVIAQLSQVCSWVKISGIAEKLLHLVATRMAGLPSNPELKTRHI